MPPEGLRTQVIAATGSGKSLIAAESAHRLSARVLVLVPTLDLLKQMAGAGRAGAMVVDEPGDMLNQLVRDVERGRIRNQRSPQPSAC
jgi:superfamily II DNA or RNA helicase